MNLPQTVETQDSSQRKFRVKTYARRESRMTRAQKKALSELLTTYELPYCGSAIDYSTIYPGARRFAVEIGFGDGEALLKQAMQNQTTAYLGIEVFRPGVGKCLIQLKRNDVRNVRVSTADARDVVMHQLPANSVDEFIVLFPDPWPKARHRKRRLINTKFIELCADRLTGGGTITVVTDFEDYAEQVYQVLADSPDLEDLATNGSFIQTSDSQLQTRYARKAEQSGNPVTELRFARRAR